MRLGKMYNLWPCNSTVKEVNNATDSRSVTLGAVDFFHHGECPGCLMRSAARRNEQAGLR